MPRQSLARRRVTAANVVKTPSRELGAGLASVPGYSPSACPAGRVPHTAEEGSLCLSEKYCPDWASPSPG